MSYSLLIVEPPVPATDAEAWAWIEARQEREPGTGPVPSAYHELIDRLTARYPCPCDLPDNEVDDAVWSDGPVRNNAGPLLTHLGISWPRVAEVTPFVVSTAQALGLTVFDPQDAQVHRPPAVTPARPRPWWQFWG